MEKIEIGIVTKPQGLKGEFRVKHFNSTFLVFENLKEIEINNICYNVVKVTNRGGFFILQTQELTSIDEVENLRNAVVFAYVSEELALDVNNNVGYEIYANNELIGIVSEVNNYGATDVYTLSNGKSFAFVPNLFESVDDNKKIIKVNKQKLAEVMV